MATNYRKFSPVSDTPNPYVALSVSRKEIFGDRDAFVLRRSSDNAESLFGYNNDYSLEEDAIAAFLNGGDGFCTTWKEQVNSIDLTQTETTTQPSYKNGASGIGGKPAFGFLADRIVKAGINYTTPATFFVVANARDIATDAGLVSTKIGSFDNNNFSFIITNSSYKISYKDNAGVPGNTPTNAGATGTDVLFTVVMDGVDKIWVYKNGVLEPNYPHTVGNGFLNKITDLVIGALNIDADVGTSLIFDAVLTDRNRKIVEENLMDYYSI